MSLESAPLLYLQCFVSASATNINISLRITCVNNYFYFFLLFLLLSFIQYTYFLFNAFSHSSISLISICCLTIFTLYILLIYICLFSLLSCNYMFDLAYMKSRLSLLSYNIHLLSASNLYICIYIFLLLSYIVLIITDLNLLICICLFSLLSCNHILDLAYMKLPLHHVFV